MLSVGCLLNQLINIVTIIIFSFRDRSEDIKKAGKSRLFIIEKGVLNIHALLLTN